MDIATAESLIAVARAEAARDGFAVAIWVLDTVSYTHLTLPTILLV